jgi:hypothetical protein
MVLMFEAYTRRLLVNEYKQFDLKAAISSISISAPISMFLNDSILLEFLSCIHTPNHEESLVVYISMISSFQRATCLQGNKRHHAHLSKLRINWFGEVTDP